MAIVVNGKRPLIDSMATLPQFDDKSIFVKLLIQPPSQSIEHRHRGSNNRRAQFFVNDFVFHTESRSPTTENSDRAMRTGDPFTKTIELAFPSV